jgi:hypothetical protein
MEGRDWTMGCSAIRWMDEWMNGLVDGWSTLKRTL